MTAASIRELSKRRVVRRRERRLAAVGLAGDGDA